MILDTSALVAVFLEEPGAEELVEKLGAAETIAIAAPTLVEAGIDRSGGRRGTGTLEPVF